MKICFSDSYPGCIDKIELEKASVPFRKGEGPRLELLRDGIIHPISVLEQGAALHGDCGSLHCSMQWEVNDSHAMLRIILENRGDTPLFPDAINLRLGIDCCMDTPKTWKDKYFPTLLRCEKTHFYGYFRSPSGHILALASPDPIACYQLEYNRCADGDYGHRIYTATLNLLHRGPLPPRHPSDLAQLAPGQSRKFDLYWIPLSDMEAFAPIVASLCHIPMVVEQLSTVAPGTLLKPKIECSRPYTLQWFGPDGNSKEKGLCDLHGIYTLYVKTDSGKIGEAKFYCRQPWDWYLKKARLQALAKPQKATTHAESWYGFFSAFLARKHFPDPELDNALSAHYQEVMPLMFDMENAHPLVIPSRIQNVSTFISLLVDKYEINPEHNRDDLLLAGKYGDWLIRQQSSDGAYRSGRTHYTCVIYVAKSMLELFFAETRAGLEEAAERHYRSVQNAVEDLVRSLDAIETEGEQTFEDGMIACSVLQISLFALTLPLRQRERYIRAAEYLMALHRCLEQTEIPDCRMRGASLRFWEAQYDVMVTPNMLCSPHGWSAWTAYAKYYLFLLTGKEVYLQELINVMGSCVELIADGDLKWAFVADPYIQAQHLTPDRGYPVSDGYSSALPGEPAYRGKREPVILGETYVDMISSWYRTGQQTCTGGYWHCPLFLEDRTVYVDNQGGACDNDVHEIFKCLEETVLENAFLVERADGTFLTLGCKASLCGTVLRIIPDPGIRTIFISNPHKLSVTVDGDIPFYFTNADWQIHTLGTLPV